MARRRRTRTGPPGLTPRAGSLFLSPPVGARRRRRRPGPSLASILAVVVLVVAVLAGAFLLVRSQLHSHSDDRRATVQKFVTAWTKGDRKAMWALIDRHSRVAYPEVSFEAAYRAGDRAAGVQAVRAGTAGPLVKGTVQVPVTVRTKDFGTLFGKLTFHVHDENGVGRVAWAPELRFPGLRPGEPVRRRSGPVPRRGNIYDAGGRLLNSDPTGASIAGSPAVADKPATGLELVYASRLNGRASTTLYFGKRVIGRVPRKGTASVHTTIRLGLQKTAQAALGDRVGAIAVVRPHDGAILALAGLALTGPQPPGSTFKIITLAAALQHKLATPSSSYPVRQFTTLSGVKLRNASNESCGGSLAKSFADSCNSVFAPLGAKIGAKDLVAAAEAFGFNEPPVLPGAKPSSIPQASDLKDDLAAGSSAIGQDRDLATALGMASVGATIANHGVHVTPRLVVGTKPQRSRAVSATVAGQVRDMMLGVVRSGTGTAAAIPGVEVAGKTGTAELRPTANGVPDPKNTDAWFVAFAPAGNPQVAVAVMLVGAGAGGAAAAPVARQVLQAALS
jgi:peptidoglycan glycosyltransferase